MDWAPICAWLWRGHYELMYRNKHSLVGILVTLATHCTNAKMQVVMVFARFLDATTFVMIRTCAWEANLSDPLFFYIRSALWAAWCCPLDGKTPLDAFCFCNIDPDHTTVSMSWFVCCCTIFMFLRALSECGEFDSWLFIPLCWQNVKEWCIWLFLCCVMCFGSGLLRLGARYHIKFRLIRGDLICISGIRLYFESGLLGAS